VALGNTSWRLLLLAWVAGEIDAFGYLSLGHVFITHVTGNTATWAIATIQGHTHEALQRGFVIVVFFLGSMCGAALVDSADDPRQITRALLVEAMLLVTFAALAWFGHLERSITGQALLLLVLSAPMGLQNAALTHVGTRGTHTTHITGPVSDLAAEMVRLIAPRRRREFSATRARRMAARLAGFSVGAVCGTTLFTVAPAVPPLLGAAVLIVVAMQGGSFRTRQTTAPRAP
jgi:uncharacterized membrane protein YoaK (UPF0700 family)